MSHSVTITRTTTTTTTSAILINTGYVKSLPGLLKVAQVIIGAVIVGLVAATFSGYRNAYSSGEEMFFLVTAAACLLATGCLLISCLLSISTASIISKTIFELVYHGVAFLLYLIASLLALIQATGSNRQYGNLYLTAALLVLLVPYTLIYLVAASLLLGTVVMRNVGYKVYEADYSTKIFSGVLGLINTILYLVSAILAYKSYRGG